MSTNPEGISGRYAAPRFAGPGGGAYHRARRRLHAERAAPPAGSVTALAAVVVRLSRWRLPSPELLGAFATAAHHDLGLSALQLARRYGCTARNVKRWFLYGGPKRRRIAASVALHAYQVTGDTTMRTVPNHILRTVQVQGARPVALVAREVARAWGVTVAQLRSSSRRAPLPEVRRAVARKAAGFGATQAEIARELRLDPSRVSRLLGGAL